MNAFVETDRLIDELKPGYIDLSDRIWGMPELRYQEEQSAAAQIEMLEAAGFKVTRNVAGIPTAFMAEAGSDGPLIGFLGEFDALAGLSQEAGVAEKHTVEGGGNGHGCGHNLLGAGAMLAAVATRDYLVASGNPGRVRYFGCPAEEGGSGKTFMAREGAFDGVDAAFCWHPASFNSVIAANSLANIQAYFRFSGRASHAAASPELGRSALDALELMSVGVQYMREHMPERARVHSAITNTGGISPNVVQDYAEALYLIRSPQVSEVMALFERVRKVAEGAAMMTETTVEVEIDKACSNLLRNSTLDQLMQAEMERVGGIQFGQEDKAFAAEIQKTLSAADIAAVYDMFNLEQKGDVPPLAGQVLSVPTPDMVLPGSTDVGDVSWQTPTAQVMTACHAVGTPFHSWQLVAQGKSGAAHQGMVFAAKTMASSAVTLFENPELLQRARQEFNAKVERTPYKCPIQSDVELPFRRTRNG
ncbi:M20 family metallopeptidase [Leisingera caerulea]|uniref:M20 family metallopeptidase n=1 Tax=Leisingera caerulea TaxID=506591 RepID=UPI000400D763|nr:M20 family metallopeptidase [Leisingera caerulea]